MNMESFNKNIITPSKC